MKVTLLTLMAGPGGIHQAGSSPDLDEATAKELIKTGHAVPCRAAVMDRPASVRRADVETAAIEEPETTADRPTRPKGK